MEKMNEKKRIEAIAIAAIIAVLFFAVGGAQAIIVTAFDDDVTPPGKMTIAGGLWHVGGIHPSSPTHSWEYTQGVAPNNNYDTGAANSGCIVSPDIDLTDANAPTTLSYWTWWQTEPDAGYDTKRVEISTDNGASWQLLEQIPGSAGSGDRALDLQVYIGNVVKIRFCFNTIDDYYNNYEGWFVDDILVEKDIDAVPEGLAVTKTVWNWKTEEWVDEIICAEMDEELEFQCVIENIGDCNLTEVRFWDAMTCSLDYLQNSVDMLVPGMGWQNDVILGRNLFKQKLLHSIDYTSGNPVGKSWKEIHPAGDEYSINAWNDTNGDGDLTACDQINVTTVPVEGSWYHVDWVGYTLNTTDTADAVWYFESDVEYDYDEPDIYDPVGTMWWKVCPGDCPDLYWASCTVEIWTNRGSSELDAGDSVCMNCTDGTHDCFTLTEDVKPDIWVSKEWDIDELNGSAVILQPGENVTIKFEAEVVEYGDDYNEQCAKAKNTTGDWIYGNCDYVHIRAPEQRVYLLPVDSSTTYCNCAEVELRINACDFKSGEIELDYDNTCVNVTDYTPNTVDFPMTEHEWNWTEAWDWITFATDQQTLTGDYLIGTLSLHCVNLSNCTSDLMLFGIVFDPFGNWKDSVIVEGGTFSCNESHVCGDVNVDGVVDIGDVGDLHNAVTYMGMWWDVADPWAGDVNCNGALEMGDVGLLHNHVQYGDPPYTLNCCPLGP